jgi:hypothetical protein
LLLGGAQLEQLIPQNNQLVLDALTSRVLFHGA